MISWRASAKDTALPAIVAILSVEAGITSGDTCIEAPLLPRISLICAPPLPMKDPHCDDGINNFNVIGGFDPSDRAFIDFAYH